MLNWILSKFNLKYTSHGYMGKFVTNKIFNCQYFSILILE